MAESSAVTWHFRRLGGMEQATLATSEELKHLAELDPKLWAALSCPASGLEFDARTLNLLDRDHDGRIRIPEILAAVEWTCERLKDPSLMASCPETLPVSAISEETEAGRRLAATARILLGENETEELSLPLVRQYMEKIVDMPMNGDGIIPVYDDLDEELGCFVKSALAIAGSVPDAGGKPGLSLPLASAFVQTLKNWKTWRSAVEQAPHPAGADTAEAWALLEKIRGKVDGYFLRCQLVAFAPETISSLNEDLAAAKKGTFEKSAIAALPLAQITSEGILNLVERVNPIWCDDLQRFAELIHKIDGGDETLSSTRWTGIQAALAPYGAALNACPKPVAVTGVETPANAISALEALGDDGVSALLAGDALARFSALVAQDLAIPASVSDVVEVEKLLLYVRNLHRLLMNFVSFQEFYSMRGTAVFQAGTLYVDGRSCRLCLPVDDVNKHAALAGLSQLCLAYCSCRRITASGAVASMNIVAAVTAGNDALLKEGRNGVFVDNTGNDWDATVVKMVRNPISLSEAALDPYRRISALIREQLAKLAANKSKDIVTSAGKKVEHSVTSISSGTAPTTTFDIGKSVGIFAAVGIALGAIGTAVGTLVNAILALHWWQFPLLFVGFFLVMSGPSVFLAWLKLRCRTLGPVLEASGWAVNAQLPLNLKLGGILTTKASLPENAESRSVIDPFQDEKSHALRNMLLVAVACAALGAGVWLWQSGMLQAVLKFLKLA